MKKIVTIVALFASLAVFIVLLMVMMTRKEQESSLLTDESKSVVNMDVVTPTPVVEPTVEPEQNQNPTPTPAPATPEIDKNKKHIALTFDDGPDKKVTNKVLDVLEKNGARATFFVIGAQVNKGKKELKRADSLGCEIGNHTFNHVNLQIKSNKQIKLQVKKTSDYVKNIIGKATTLVRPPFGSVNPRVKKAVNKPMIYWTIDTNDWDTLNAQKTVHAIKKQVKDGDIILMHDIYDSTAKAVEIIVPWLKKQGYELVTVSELAKTNGIKLKNGSLYVGLHK